MEFGARAMGNRSILANPADHRVIRTINDMIKNRDFWMPFAPSLIAEEENIVLTNPKHMPAPYMIMSFDSIIDHSRIFAASHPYDRTVRPQVVYRDWNTDYHRLISYFKDITGTGVILNTSFNLHGFPIVCSPGDAIDVFHHSGLKYLAIGNFLVRKR
jgi:carbamoyltransferase